MVYQYKIRYDRDFGCNYMVLETELVKFDEQNYELAMLLNNEIEGILKVDLKGVNDTISLYYHITSKQPLAQLLIKEPLTFNKAVKLIKTTIETIQKGEEYLLNQNHYVINPDYIYIEPSTWMPSICYLPCIEEAQSVNISFKDLIEFLMMKVKQDDQKVILLIHQLYKKTREQNYTLGEIEKILLQFQNEKEVNEVKFDQEEKIDCKDSDIIHKEQKKGMASKKIAHPVQQEVIVEEKEIAVYPLKYKIFAVILQCIGVGLIVLIITSNTFIDEATGKLDLIKLMAFIAIIMAIDGYSLIKMFNEKNKEIHIIEEEKIVPVTSIPPHQRPNMSKKSIKHIGQGKEELSSFDNNEPFKMPQYLTVYGSEEMEGTTVLNETEDDCATTILSEKENYNDMGYLILASTGEKVLIDTSPFVIGKLKGQVDYEVNHSTVSRVHAQILIENKQFYLMDLNSRNGTWINDKPLNSQHKYLLQIGDFIKFSNIVFKFALEE